MGANPTVISQWFDLLKKIQMEVGIVSPAQIWSGDETGVQNVPKEIKVLGIKNIRTFQQVSSEQGETSTILSFVNALGNVVPPNDYPQRPASAGYMENQGTWQHSYFSNNKGLYNQIEIPRIWSEIY